MNEKFLESLRFDTSSNNAKEDYGTTWGQSILKEVNESENGEIILTLQLLEKNKIIESKYRGKKTFDTIKALEGFQIAIEPKTGEIVNSWPLLDANDEITK